MRLRDKRKPKERKKKKKKKMQQPKHAAARKRMGIAKQVGQGRLAAHPHTNQKPKQTLSMDASIHGGHPRSFSSGWLGWAGWRRRRRRVDGTDATKPRALRPKGSLQRFQHTTTTTTTITLVLRPSVRPGGGGDAPVTIETRPHQVSHDKHGGVVHTHIRVAKEKKKPELHFGLLPHESQSVNHTHTHLDNSSADTYGNEYANKLIIAQKARMIKDEMK